MPFDYNQLRSDLMDYYGTAAFSGFPVAMMDVMKVEKMNDNELYSCAARNGFNMLKYQNQPTSYTPNYTNHFTYSANTTAEKKEEYDYPKMVIMPVSKEAEKLIKDKPDWWEYLLFSQCIYDNYMSLSKFKKQDKDNVLVKAIGKNCEGAILFGYIKGIVESLLKELDLLEATMKSILPELEKSLGEPGEDGDAELIEQVSRRFMEPYWSLLITYNDIKTIKSSFPDVFEELARIVETMMNDCEKFYETIHRDIPRAIYNPQGEKITLNFCMSFSGFSTEKVLNYIKRDSDKLMQAKLQRK